MLTVRTAFPADAARLRTLAELDSAVVPGGELLIAEQDGRSDGRAVPRVR